MMDIVLITEASGYTGSHIAEHLLKAGYRVRGTVKPERVSALRMAYLEYQDRFEAVGITDLDHDDLTDIFRGVGTLIVASLPPVRGRTTEEARSTVESASSGTKHLLAYTRAASVKKIVYTGSFQNAFHPSDSWNPITITEDDWNPQTEDDCNRLGLHPWCLHTAASVIAERELWKFADANPEVDVTSILPGFTFGPYGRGQAIDQHRAGTFAWVSELLHGRPGRPMLPNAPPFSPNYVHVADVARAHVAALRVGPLNPPRRRKRVLLVAGYVLWHDVVAHLSEAMPEIRERLPSVAGGPGPRQVSSFARFETRNARDILGIEEYRGWKEAIEDAVKDVLRVESRMTDL
ncbi:hypothetical protein EDB87DRAFT_287706 [Lactarius vividus]|nr:hypothetical protein EDB87DRAFT_287706 [Lactarius vividus]